MNRRKWWLAAAMALVNAFTSLGFSLAGLLTSGNDIFAMYAAARSIPLAAITVLFVARRASRALAAVALVLGLVQACDAIVGLVAGDAGKTIGPFVLAALTLASIRWLQVESGKSGATT